MKVSIANVGEFDLCIEDQALYTSDGTQSFFLDNDITDSAWEVEAGDDLDTYYGNWTTANGYYYPYYGLPAWWCVEYGQYAAASATFDYFGEQIPDALAYYISTATDVDGDGTTDKNDWAGTFGVQANYNIWNYQNSYGILTAGKVAEASGCAVLVTLTSRNIGYDTASGTLTDTVPAGWTASDYSTTPDTETLNADGTTTLEWSVTVTGTYGGIVLDLEQITYMLDSDGGADTPYLELPEADVYFDGGEGHLTNYSLPAAVYNLDIDCDGEVSCTEEEVCDGVDNDLDGDVDEGFDTDGDGFADCMEECLVEERFCSDEDGLNYLEDGSDAVLTYDGNSRWTATISGAEWIWDEYYETNPEGDEVQSIFRDFAVQDGYYDLDASLEIGADNSYEVWLNASSVASDSTETNYFAPTDVWDLSSAIATGDNGLEFEVWNWAQPGGSAYSNPGGLLYCVDVAYSYEMDLEVCDGVDNDCDGLVDDDDSDVGDQGTWYLDADGDGFGDSDTAVVSCDAPDGYVDDDTDCDDGDASVNPGSSETCDDVDNDCDGLVDDDDSDVSGQTSWYLDADGDSYGDAGDSVTSCDAPTGYVEDDSDCDDDDAGISPAAAEVCDGVDNDCDGSADEDFDSDADGLADCYDSEECDGVDNDGDGLVDDDDPDVEGQSSWYADADGDGYGDAGSDDVACFQPTDYVADDTDCDDGDADVNPGATESCNGTDDDCDGDTDEGFDSDADGVADCFDTEECDGLDNDGDGLVDDDDSDVEGQSTWYADADGDGYGDADSTVDACEAPSGYGDDTSDCDDADADVNPDAIEVCNEIDDDCDGGVDEDLDCGEDDCPEVEPDECLTLWQAHSRGWLWVESGSGGTVTFTNMGIYDVCIDEHGLYTSTGTQSMFVEGELVGAIELAPTESLTLYYGSWTTDNGYYSPYLGNDSWWCVENNTTTASGYTYDWYGEEVPAVLSSYVESGWDADGDGVDDLEDWAGSYGVQAQYNIWAYQSTNAVLTAGKLAEVDGDEIIVTVTSRNVGYDDGTGELTDTIPAGWSAISYDVEPDSEVDNGDGTVSVSWAVDVAGTGGGTTVDADTFSYVLLRDCASDAPYTELPEAYVVYDDTEGEQTSWSMPAAAYNLDGDGDGVVDCAEEELCDGLDNDLDCDIDEGFDVDADGWTSCSGDCDDDDAAVNPDATEVCNDIDDDCDALVDDDDADVADQSTWYADADSDDYGDAADSVDSCDQPDGYVADATDCDDSDATVNPDATEACNDIDDDCDGLVDDDDSPVSGTSTWYADSDGDGFGDPWATATSCDAPSGFVADGSDCDDVEADVNPGADEVCNGIDDDCDGLVDDDDTDVTDQSIWYADSDGDGYGDPRTTTAACEEPSGFIDDGSDCDDGDAAVNPDALEVCNTVDDDCDGDVDEDDVCAGDDCDDVVPDDRLTVWQAHARGWLTVASAGSGEEVNFVNAGVYDVCLDERALYASDDTQAFFLDAAIVDLPEELAMGEDYSAYYGSWTTDNDTYEPYLGEGAWWCVDNGRTATSGGSYVYYGEEAPDVLTSWVDDPTDVDSDGVSDLEDWAGSYGVQSQYNIWDWQFSEPVLTSGKVAEEVLGDVVVTLTSRNLGDQPGEGWLVDTVPAGWTVTSTEVSPDHTVPYADGSSVMTCFVELDAWGGSADATQFSYTMIRDVEADLAYLELDSAWVTYATECGDATDTIVIFPPDCMGETSWSLPAAVYNLDVDQDGVQSCPEEEVCDGLDNDLDGDVDEDLPDSDSDGTCDDLDEEECNGLDNDGDGVVDEDCPGTISGAIFFDEDQDGEQGSCEPGVVGVVVWADGPDCGGDGAEDSWETTTDDDGAYVFTDLCDGDWVVSWEEQSFDQPTTDNPAEVALAWAGDEVVDFGMYRAFHVATKCWWLSHPAAVEEALPFDVGGTTYTSYAQVRATLNSSACGWAASLQRLLVLAKLNDARFGIGAHPWMDFDGDGECETIGDLIDMADDALITGDWTTFRNWVSALLTSI